MMLPESTKTQIYGNNFPTYQDHNHQRKSYFFDNFINVLLFKILL